MIHQIQHLLLIQTSPLGTDVSSTSSFYLHFFDSSTKVNSTRNQHKMSLVIGFKLQVQWIKKNHLMLMLFTNPISFLHWSNIITWIYLVEMTWKQHLFIQWEASMNSFMSLNHQWANNTNVNNGTNASHPNITWLSVVLEEWHTDNGSTVYVLWWILSQWDVKYQFTH